VPADDVLSGVYAILNKRNRGLELQTDTLLGSGGMGLDSIALVEVLLECEDRFGVEAASEALAGSPLTVGSLVETILVLLPS
jgi:acyl carrier protein